MQQLGLIIPPENVRHTVKNAYIVMSRDTSLNFAIPNNVENLLGLEIHQATDILIVMCLK